MTEATTAGRDAVTPGANRTGRWTAGATTLLAALVDVVFGVEASLIVPLVFGPFVASALASVRDTVVVAMVATVLGVVLGWSDGTVGSSAHVARVVSVASGGCLAVWLSVQRVAREAKLQAITHVAEVAQEAILHPLPAQIGGVRVAARYISASAEAQIGGDFYEAVDTKWGVRIMVGDVRGKGLDARGDRRRADRRSWGVRRCRGDRPGHPCRGGLRRPRRVPRRLLPRASSAQGSPRRRMRRARPGPSRQSGG